MSIYYIHRLIHLALVWTEFSIGKYDEFNLFIGYNTLWLPEIVYN